MTREWKKYFIGWAAMICSILAGITCTILPFFFLPIEVAGSPIMFGLMFSIGCFGTLGMPIWYRR